MAWKCAYDMGNEDCIKNFGMENYWETSTWKKMAVFRDVAPCSLVEVCRRFRGAFCLHHQNNDDGGNKNL
jgi:hypothetical protein